MTQFIRTKLVNFEGSTSLAGYLEIAPAALVKAFGAPDEGDEYKVSGEYLFESPNGVPFTLYDWKCTTLYDTQQYAGGRALSPKKFWAQTQPITMNVGSTMAGKHGAKLIEFTEWVYAQCK